MVKSKSFHRKKKHFISLSRLQTVTKLRTKNIEKPLYLLQVIIKFLKINSLLLISINNISETILKIFSILKLENPYFIWEKRG